jgi:hypothetical protein
VDLAKSKKEITAALSLPSSYHLNVIMTQSQSGTLSTDGTVSYASPVIGRHSNPYEFSGVHPAIGAS